MVFLQLEGNAESVFQQSQKYERNKKKEISCTHECVAFSVLHKSLWRREEKKNDVVLLKVQKEKKTTTTRNGNIERNVPNEKSH